MGYGFQEIYTAGMAFCLDFLKNMAIWLAVLANPGTLSLSGTLSLFCFTAQIRF